MCSVTKVHLLIWFKLLNGGTILKLLKDFLHYPHNINNPNHACCNISSACIQLVSNYVYHCTLIFIWNILRYDLM